MKKEKKVIEIKKDEKEPVVEVKASVKKAELKAIIEAYKVQNPWKYEMKKKALDEQLANL